MKKTLSQLMVAYFLVLSLAGFFVEGHLFKFINSDITIDFIRLGLALIMLYAGFISKNAQIVGIILSTIGFLEMVIGIIAIISSNMVGLAPSGFTSYDAWSHMLLGLLAYLVGWNKQFSLVGEQSKYNEPPRQNLRSTS